MKDIPATTVAAAGGSDVSITPSATSERLAASGIPALDQRLGGGLKEGGVYVAAGPPGPAKLVAALHFLHQGLSNGRRCLLITGAPASDVLEVGSAQGMDLRAALLNGTLDIVGFREDFEMRVLRSAEPEDVLEELSSLVTPDVERVAVDPGGLLLQGGARTLLGRTFLDWARRQPATFLLTLSIDGADLPSSAEWLIQSTTGILLFDKDEDGSHYDVDLRHLTAGIAGPSRVTLQLIEGRGLVAPEGGPSRRRGDRPAGDPHRLLFLSLDAQSATDLEEWARGIFATEVVHEPLEAVPMLQAGPGFGCVLVYTSRARVPDAVRTCRALRPLTRASILVVSDDAMRAGDRVDLLEAGADDCQSGGVDVRELRARIQQAVATGGKPARKELWPKRERLVGGLVDGRVFASEVRARIVDPRRSVLTVLRVSDDAERTAFLRDLLAEEMRADEGDMLVPAGRAFLVVLQGARRDAAGVFLDRVRRRSAAGNGATPVRSEVFSHPGERREILGLLGLLHGGEAPKREIDQEETRARGG